MNEGAATTLNELSQLYYLNREIEMRQRELAGLEAQATSVSGSDLSGIPHGHGGRSAVERYAAEIADLKAIIAAKQIECIHERNRLERYIAGIEDSLTRQIFQ